MTVREVLYITDVCVVVQILDESNDRSIGGTAPYIMINAPYIMDRKVARISIGNDRFEGPAIILMLVKEEDV